MSRSTTEGQRGHISWLALFLASLMAIGTIVGCATDSGSRSSSSDSHAGHNH
ncbi:MAG: hypothetical protein H6822_02210 [Planctomycetaceae bacterium]|nr:hypothetical protein [Planctomycetales bacterium]MCB9920964.1 hypothetical protein [Planctomycetaceae bacterium]